MGNNEDPAEQVSQCSQLTSKEKRFEEWLVPSRLPVSPPEERLPGSSWPPRLPESRRPRPAASRSPTGTALVPSLSVRSVVTRNPLSFSSANCPSRGWSEKLLRTSKPISGSKVQPSAPFRRPVKLTWLAFSRTPTCAQSTPSV